MRINSLAGRYAQALFGSAKKTGKTEEILADLGLVEEVCKGDLIKVLTSPVVSAEKKKSVLADLFGGKVNSLTLNFLLLSADKNREIIFPVIREEYEKIYNEANSVRDLVIESVIYLNEEQKELIRTKLEKKLGLKLRVKNILNSDLIGGVRLRIGDTVTDGSVISRLTGIKDCLSK